MRSIELFAGCGGLAKGLELAGFKHSALLEINHQACESLRANYNPSIVHEVDIKKVDFRVFEGIDVISGGPPCQPFSLGGLSKAYEDSRDMFPQASRSIAEAKPRAFLFENVKGLLSASNGWFKDEIVKTIDELGYLVEFGLLNASKYGVPQGRERAIFICSRHNKVALPEPTIEKNYTVRDAISDLSYLESGEGDFEQEYKMPILSDYQRMMRNGSCKLYNHKASNHKQVAIEKLKMIPPEKGKEFLPEELHGNQKFKTTWGRLKWDDVSPTIDTRFDASSNGTNNHPYLHRAITPREAARLQSFDDNFIFYGAKVHVRKQIGNAVPPLLAKAIADQIDKKLDLAKDKEK